MPILRTGFAVQRIWTGYGDQYLICHPHGGALAYGQFEGGLSGDPQLAARAAKTPVW
jgi:hypothetical protein